MYSNAQANDSMCVLVTYIQLLINTTIVHFIFYLNRRSFTVVKKAQMGCTNIGATFYIAQCCCVC